MQREWFAPDRAEIWSSSLWSSSAIAPLALSSCRHLTPVRSEPLLPAKDPPNPRPNRLQINYDDSSTVPAPPLQRPRVVSLSTLSTLHVFTCFSTVNEYRNTPQISS